MKACSPQPGADAKHAGQAPDTFPFSSRLVKKAQTDAATSISLHRPAEFTQSARAACFRVV